MDWVSVYSQSARETGRNHGGIHTSAVTGFWSPRLRCLLGMVRGKIRQRGIVQFFQLFVRLVIELDGDKICVEFYSSRR